MCEQEPGSISQEAKVYCQIFWISIPHSVVHTNTAMTGRAVYHDRYTCLCTLPPKHKFMPEKERITTEDIQIQLK